MMAQNISGVVYDSKKEPLVGVTVTVKGTTKGTSTDENGKFSITGIENIAKATLVFSYIGYMPIEQPIGNTTSMIITMNENSKNLDELIVVGYGTQKKSVVTAAISKITSDDLDKVAAVRIDDALKGITSGVTVTTASGQPGAGF